MNRIDYRDVFRENYSPPHVPVVRVNVPPRHGLVLEGDGPVSSEAFAAKIAAVRVLAKALRKRLKDGPMALDFRVMPIEFTCLPDGHWRVFLFQPPVVDAALVHAEQATLARKGDGLAAQIEFARLPESSALLTFHADDLHTVDAALERLDAFAAASGLVLSSGYDAVDLGDSRKPPYSQAKILVRRSIQS